MPGDGIRRGGDVMATNPMTRAKYRNDSVALKAAAKAAIELLNIYSWDSTDGQINFTTEPNRAKLNNREEFDLEIRGRWSALRAALIIAGVMDAELEPGQLPGDAQFLRVQTQDLTLPNGALVWQTRALFEVFMNVNTYGYADGEALDIFYKNARAVAVRVVRHTLPNAARVDYANGDLSGVVGEVVIGQINPFENPDVADGWAIIGEHEANPEPDFFGMDNPRFVVLNIGVEGAQGQQGERGLQGVPGLRGVPGVDGAPGVQGERGWQGGQGEKGDKGDKGEPGGGGGGVVPKIPISISISFDVAPRRTDAYAIFIPVQVVWFGGDVSRYLSAVWVRVEGGDGSPDSDIFAVAKFDELLNGGMYPNLIETGLIGGGQSYQAQLPEVAIVNVMTGVCLRGYSGNNEQFIVPNIALEAILYGMPGNEYVPALRAGFVGANALEALALRAALEWGDFEYAVYPLGVEQVGSAGVGVDMYAPRGAWLGALVS